jgi:hypothetical protein
MNGKGDQTRPSTVSHQQYINNWDKAFNKEKTKEKSNKD